MNPLYAENKEIVGLLNAALYDLDQDRFPEQLNQLFSADCEIQFLSSRIS